MILSVSHLFILSKTFHLPHGSLFQLKRPSQQLLKKSWPWMGLELCSRLSWIYLLTKYSTLSELSEATEGPSDFRELCLHKNNTNQTSLGTTQILHWKILIMIYVIDNNSYIYLWKASCYNCHLLVNLTGLNYQGYILVLKNCLKSLLIILWTPLGTFLWLFSIPKSKIQKFLKNKCSFFFPWFFFLGRVEVRRWNCFNLSLIFFP